ncbi:hypothetical protein HDU96_009811 [Phlyctochytrium bullatum]|nr:hypothetical protein HDU96_009811 [Phlyctochytrium bullatum]
MDLLLKATELLSHDVPASTTPAAKHIPRHPQQQNPEESDEDYPHPHNRRLQLAEQGYPTPTTTASHLHSHPPRLGYHYSHAPAQHEQKPHYFQAKSGGPNPPSPLPDEQQEYPTPSSTTTNTGGVSRMSAAAYTKLRLWEDVSADGDHDDIKAEDASHELPSPDTSAAAPVVAPVASRHPAHHRAYAAWAAEAAAAGAPPPAHHPYVMDLSAAGATPPQSPCHLPSPSSSTASPMHVPRSDSMGSLGSGYASCGSDGSHGDVDVSPEAAAAAAALSAATMGRMMVAPPVRRGSACSSTGSGESTAAAAGSGGASKQIRRYPCKQPGCSRSFTRLFNLKAHMETHNPDRERSFKCEHCGVAFCRAQDLLRHGTVHDKSNLMVCPACPNKTFSRKDALRRHIRVNGCCPLDSI